MAISLGTEFEVLTNLPIDKRLVLTKTEMLNMNDNKMPSTYFATCSEDGKLYLYNKDNTIDSTTGKFRVFEGGGGSVDNMVTTDTEQDITASKTFTKTVYIESINAKTDPDSENDSFEINVNGEEGSRFSMAGKSGTIVLQGGEGKFTFNNHKVAVIDDNSSDDSSTYSSSKIEEKISNIITHVGTVDDGTPGCIWIE